MQRQRQSLNVLGVAMVAIVAMAAAIPFTGAAADEDEPNADTMPGPARRGCFYAREATDFDVLDARNIIVYAPNRRNAYRVRIAPQSNELRFAERLAFLGRAGMICGRAGESVAFERSGSRRPYSVSDVWRLDEAQLQQLEQRFSSNGDSEETAPTATGGAEVERNLPGGNNSQ